MAVVASFGDPPLFRDALGASMDGTDRPGEVLAVHRNHDNTAELVPLDAVVANEKEDFHNKEILAERAALSYFRDAADETVMDYG